MGPDAGALTCAVDGATATIAVTAVDDQLVEATTETFTNQSLTITSSGGANVTASGAQTVVVTDNDSATVMEDFIDIVRPINKLLPSSVPHHKPRRSPNAFHLSGSVGNRLIGVGLLEESKLKAR